MIPVRVKEADCLGRKSFHLTIGGIMLFTLVALIGVWFSAALQIQHDRAVTEAAARQRAEEIARTFEVRLADRLEHIDHMMLHVRDDLREPSGLQPGHLSAASINLEIPGLLQLSMIDAAGQRVDSTIPFTPGDDLGDREFFRVHRNRPTRSGADPIFIGKPVAGNLPHRQMVMHLTRRVDSRDGQFLGVCVFRRIRPGVSVESAHRFGETAHPN